MRTSLTVLALLTAAASGPASAQTSTDMGAGVPPSASTPPGPEGPRGYGGGRGGPPSPEMRAARRAVREQCAADVARLCPDAAAAMTAQAPPEGSAPPGAGRRGGMFQCVRQHVSELGAGCRQALDAMRAARPAQGGEVRGPSMPPG